MCMCVCVYVNRVAQIVIMTHSGCILHRIMTPIPDIFVCLRRWRTSDFLFLLHRVYKINLPLTYNSTQTFPLREKSHVNNFYFSKSGYFTLENSPEHFLKRFLGKNYYSPEIPLPAECHCSWVACQFWHD